MDVYERIFPVAAGDFTKEIQDDIMILRQVIGTCFSIGGGYFLTAAHVLQDAYQCKWSGISFPYEGRWQGSPFLDTEILEDLDIGVFKAETPNIKLLRWNDKSYPMLQAVQSIGYPYAVDFKNIRLTVRGFAGHIVSEQNFHDLKGKPRIYELSFQAPRGLSGAPLFTVEKGMTVSGLIIGNRTTEMLIYSDKEIISDGKSEKIVERYEALQLGIAIQSIAILDINYTVLGGTLRKHLANHGLIG
jgi:hypothetical protein